MTPTPLDPVVEGTEDTMDLKQGPEYVHDVKIEFVLKSPGEKVYANTAFGSTTIPTFPSSTSQL